MDEQGDKVALAQAEETGNGTEEIEKKGRRKWFKRSTSVSKRTSDKSETKPRSRSVFGFLFNLGRKKDKNKSKTVTVPSADLEKDEDDHDETIQGEMVQDETVQYESFVQQPDGTPTMTDQLLRDSQYSDDDQERTNGAPSKAEIEFNQSMADIKQDWLDFGKSLDMADQDMLKILEKAEVVSKRSSTKMKDQAEKASLPVIDEDDPEMDDLVAKAPSLALGSADQGYEWPSIMPLGFGNTSECVPWSFMSHPGNKKEGGLNSAGSFNDATALTTYESEPSSNLIMSHTAEAMGSVSSFYSTTAESVTCQPTTSINANNATGCPSKNFLSFEIGEERADSLDEECMQELVGLQGIWKMGNLKSALEGESKSVTPEESK